MPPKKKAPTRRRMVGRGAADAIAMAIATALAKKAAEAVINNKTVRRNVAKGVRSLRKFTGLGYRLGGDGLHLGGGLMLAGQRDSHGRFLKQRGRGHGVSRAVVKKVIRTRIL